MAGHGGGAGERGVEVVFERAQGEGGVGREEHGCAVGFEEEGVVWGWGGGGVGVGLWGVSGGDWMRGGGGGGGGGYHCLFGGRGGRMAAGWGVV